MHVATLARAGYRIIVVTVPVVIVVVIVVVATARTADRRELCTTTAADPHHAFTLAPTATSYTSGTIVKPVYQLDATTKAGVALLIAIASALANDDVVIVSVTGEISVVATRVCNNPESCTAASINPDGAGFIAPALSLQTWGL